MSYEMDLSYMLSGCTYKVVACSTAVQKLEKIRANSMGHLQTKVSRVQALWYNS